MIEVKDLKYNDYLINLIIDEYENNIIFSSDLNLLKTISLQFAGLNKSDILFHNELLYDNLDYFKNRIYIDTSLSYLNTLNEKQISRYILDQYGKVFLENDFKRIIKELNIRFYTDIKERYYFTDLGNNLANLAFVLSIVCFRIIYLPYKNIINENKYFNNEFENKKNNLIFEDIKNINKYNNCLNNIIILYNNNIFKFKGNEKIIEIINLNNESDICNKYLINKIDNISYFSNNLLNDKEVLKELKGIKLKEINLFDMGEKYEKN